MDSLFVTDEEWDANLGFRPEPLHPLFSKSAPTADENGLIQRRNSRPHISLEHRVRWERLNPLPEAGAEFLELFYDVGGDSVSGDQAIIHSGREYGLVLEGVLSVQVGLEKYTLEAGDSIAFDSTIPHRFWNSGDVPVRAVWFELKYGWPPEVGGSRDASARPLY